MFQTIYRLMIELTNGKWTSKAIKAFATSKFSRYVIPHFSRIYRINQEEMLEPIHTYSTLHSFFIRRLKEDVRPVDQEPLAIVSPVDSVLEDIGPITEDNIIHVKGKDYSISEMLGNDELLKKYVGGTFMVLYLSPSHYHRIHSPVTGKITHQWSLGRKSYPVNKPGLKYGKQTLSKNYRLISEIAHEKAHLTVVKVGAMFVNSIETVHVDEEVIKGEEMAYFTFGSTIVLLFEKNSVNVTVGTNLPLPLKVGERIALLK